MTPITRSVAMLARVLGMPSGHNKVDVMDAVFQHIVAVYCARSGRSETDVLEEIEEHTEGKNDSFMTRYCMECLYLLGQAA
eukprot:CAMPEP_0185784484 /NCGR_PEP_ID=MMETSP1174-20130828/123410_1 /TAXON_ID=35687 /ORGANISM="Dictyocha speculum, Strain CCMP1381" /LENGTH=80 /DNA_ID=CAMNT_0028476081 /DNA_START=602 /DNA_END=844 /DNA_ORIENTATION=+